MRGILSRVSRGSRFGLRYVFQTAITCGDLRQTRARFFISVWRTQKLWFDPDRIKNDSAKENSSDELNSETEIDDEDKETNGGDDNVILKTGSEEEPINFETASEDDEKFIPFTMRLCSNNPCCILRLKMERGNRC